MSFTTGVQVQGCSSLSQKIQQSRCRFVYFLGGGKAGSSSLEMNLKTLGTNVTGITHSGGEPCWVQRQTKKWWTRSGRGWDHCEAADPTPTVDELLRATVALDSCPRYHSAKEAKEIFCAHPYATFIVLLRDPVTRAVSHFNDNYWRLGSPRGNVDQNLRHLSGMNWFLGAYTEGIENFLKYFPPCRFLLLRTRALSNPKVMAVLRDFMGVPQQAENDVTKRNRKNRTSISYWRPTDETVRVVANKYEVHTERLFELIGKRLPWLTGTSNSTEIANAFPASVLHS